MPMIIQGLMTCAVASRPYSACSQAHVSLLLLIHEDNYEQVTKVKFYEDEQPPDAQEVAQAKLVQ